MSLYIILYLQVLQHLFHIFKIFYIFFILSFLYIFMFCLAFTFSGFTFLLYYAVLFFFNSQFFNHIFVYFQVFCIFDIFKFYYIFYVLKFSIFSLLPCLWESWKVLVACTFSHTDFHNLKNIKHVVSFTKQSSLISPTPYLILTGT